MGRMGYKCERQKSGFNVYMRAGIEAMPLLGNDGKLRWMLTVVAEHLSVSQTAPKV
jgi:hypothetical protein